jgi:hypothetical protein
MKESLTKYSKAAAQAVTAITLAASVYVHKDGSENSVLIEAAKDNSPPVTRQNKLSSHKILLKRPAAVDHQVFTEIDFSSKEIPITQTPTPIQNRNDCDAIRGTDYRSGEERSFFQENCKLKATGYYPKSEYSKRSPAEWADIVCSSDFTWDCDFAIRHIDCESKGDPNAQGVEIDQLTGKVLVFNGLFQVHNGPFDPYRNAVEANIQYVQWINKQRADPWPNCS